MSRLSCGIVGLPNVGKSTLFNTLTKRSVSASNYPFCTIEPNVGIVDLPDKNLLRLHQTSSSERLICAPVKFVDIAGLIEGASNNEGLGNKFLSHIKEVSVILHVVRLFANEQVVHVGGNVDPIRDINIIENELKLADLQNLEKKIKKDPLANEIIHAIENNRDLPDDIEEYHLLSTKPKLYCVNVDEGDEYNNIIDELREYTKSIVISLSIKLEDELSSLNDEEAKEYMSALGMNERGIDKVIISVFSLLGLQTFYTSGDKESRAWVIKKNTNARDAAGKIHEDFKKNFVMAEIVNIEDFVKHKGFKGAKENGKVRLEGEDYIMQPNDVVIFKAGC